MKDLVLFLFIFLIIVSLMYRCETGNSVVDEYIHQDSLMRTKVGTKVLMNKDTSFIVDYSFWASTYTTDKGIVIQIDFYEKNKTK